VDLTSHSRERPALFIADCLVAMRALPTESVDLVYFDPPFGTGQRQRVPSQRPRQRLKQGEGDAEEEEGQRAPDASFADAWPSTEAYLEFMRARLAECWRLLKPTGSILLHCDWRHSHRLRVLLDDLCGAENFVNHLIWSYGLGGSSPRRFARKHDDILFYAKGPHYWFTAPRVAATSNRMRGLDKKATDVLDIASLNNMSRERCGWPTQKPLALLRLLVGACCPPGGTLLDPCCGSGTSLVAAVSLGRRAIGIDSNELAIAISASRLSTEGGQALPEQ